MYSRFIHIVCISFCNWMIFHYTNISNFFGRHLNDAYLKVHIQVWIYVFYLGNSRFKFFFWGTAKLHSSCIILILEAQWAMWHKTQAPTVPGRMQGRVKSLPTRMCLTTHVTLPTHARLATHTDSWWQSGCDSHGQGIFIIVILV